MEYSKIELKSFKEKVNRSIEKYLNISSKVSLSIGIYYQSGIYICNLNENEEKLYYDIGSITKTITAHMIMKKVVDGSIDLNKDISNYICLKKGNYPSIKQLLTHTAGYFYLSPIEITVPSLVRRNYAKKNIYLNCNKEKLIKSIERRRKNKRILKNLTYSYSDYSHALLSLVLENIENKPFSELISEYFKKMKMNNTFLSLDSERLQGVLSDKYVKAWEWNLNNPYIASGGVVSNIYDMMKYVKEEIESNDDYILEGQEVNEDSFSKNGRIGMCLAWHTYKNSNQLWHVGGVGTFRSSVIINRKKKLGVMVLGNSKGKKSANVHYLAKMIYSELKLKRIRIN